MTHMIVLFSLVYLTLLSNVQSFQLDPEIQQLSDRYSAIKIKIYQIETEDRNNIRKFKYIRKSENEHIQNALNKSRTSIAPDLPVEKLVECQSLINAMFRKEILNDFVQNLTSKYQQVSNLLNIISKAASKIEILREKVKIINRMMDLLWYKNADDDGKVPSAEKINKHMDNVERELQPLENVSKLTIELVDKLLASMGETSTYYKKMAERMQNVLSAQKCTSI